MLNSFFLKFFRFAIILGMATFVVTLPGFCDPSSAGEQLRIQAGDNGQILVSMTNTLAEEARISRDSKRLTIEFPRKAGMNASQFDISPALKSAISVTTTPSTEQITIRSNKVTLLEPASTLDAPAASESLPLGSVIKGAEPFEEATEDGTLMRLVGGLGLVLLGIVALFKFGLPKLQQMPWFQSLSAQGKDAIKTTQQAPISLGKMNKIGPEGLQQDNPKNQADARMAIKHRLMNIPTYANATLNDEFPDISPQSDGSINQLDFKVKATPPMTAAPVPSSAPSIQASPSTPHQPASPAHHRSSPIQPIANIDLGQHKALHLVSIAGQQVILGSTQQNIQMLATLTSKGELDPVRPIIAADQAIQPEEASRMMAAMPGIGKLPSQQAISPKPTAPQVPSATQPIITQSNRPVSTSTPTPTPSQQGINQPIAAPTQTTATGATLSKAVSKPEPIIQDITDKIATRVNQHFEKHQALQSQLEAIDQNDQVFQEVYKKYMNAPSPAPQSGNIAENQNPVVPQQASSQTNRWTALEQSKTPSEVLVLEDYQDHFPEESATTNSKQPLLY